MPCNMHNDSTPGDWIKDDYTQREYRKLEAKTKLLEAALCSAIRWQGLYSVLDAMVQNGQTEDQVKAVRRWYMDHAKRDLEE